MDEELISIITPIFNQEKSIVCLVESILHQTYMNWELILINDGSTDQTKAVCEKYCAVDSRICLKSIKHVGQAAARNIGLQLSNGKYISFADADDYMHPDMLLLLHKNLIETNSDISICGFEDEFNKHHLNSKPIYNKRKVVCLNHVSLNEQQEMLKDDVYLWNKLFRRELFAKICFEPSRYYEDLAIMHLLFMKSNKAVYFPQKLYLYRYNNKGTVACMNKKKMKDYVYAAKKKLSFYHEMKWKRDERHFANSFVYQIYFYYKNEKNYQLKRYLRKTLLNAVKYHCFLHYFPLHGKVRLIVFCYFPNLYELIYLY